MDTTTNSGGNKGMMFGVIALVLAILLGGGAFFYTYTTTDALKTDVENVSSDVENINTEITNISDSLEKLVGPEIEPEDIEEEDSPLLVNGVYYSDYDSDYENFSIAPIAGWEVSERIDDDTGEAIGVYVRKGDIEIHILHGSFGGPLCWTGDTSTTSSIEEVGVGGEAWVLTYQQGDNPAVLCEITDDSELPYVTPTRYGTISVEGITEDNLANIISILETIKAYDSSGAVDSGLE